MTVGDDPWRAVGRSTQQSRVRADERAQPGRGPGQRGGNVKSEAVEN